jgi:hypothetical protein
MRDNPKISFRLRDHKIAILVTWTVLFLGSGIFPVVLYFTIRYAAHAKIALGKPLLYSLYFQNRL